MDQYSDLIGFRDKMTNIKVEVTQRRMVSFLTVYYISAKPAFFRHNENFTPGPVFM